MWSLMGLEWRDIKQAGRQLQDTMPPPPPAVECSCNQVHPAAIAIPSALGPLLILALVWLAMRWSGRTKARHKAQRLYQLDVRAGPDSKQVELQHNLSHLLYADHQAGRSLQYEVPDALPSRTSNLRRRSTAAASSVPDLVYLDPATVASPGEGIDLTRQDILAATQLTSAAELDNLVILSLLGQGTYGSVYKASWKGIIVAVKVMRLNGHEKREKMAVMEAAISSSLSHPNIIQTFTFSVKTLDDTPPERPSLGQQPQLVRPGRPLQPARGLHASSGPLHPMQPSSPTHPGTDRPSASSHLQPLPSGTHDTADRHSAATSAASNYSGPLLHVTLAPLFRGDPAHGLRAARDGVGPSGPAPAPALIHQGPSARHSEDVTPASSTATHTAPVVVVPRHPPPPSSEPTPDVSPKGAWPQGGSHVEISIRSDAASAAPVRAPSRLRRHTSLTGTGMVSTIRQAQGHWGALLGLTPDAHQRSANMSRDDGLGAGHRSSGNGQSSGKASPMPSRNPSAGRLAGVLGTHSLGLPKIAANAAGLAADGEPHRTSWERATTGPQLAQQAVGLWGAAGSRPEARAGRAGRRTPGRAASAMHLTAGQRDMAAADGGQAGSGGEGEGLGSWEVRLVQEFAEAGSLRDLLDKGGFLRAGGEVNLVALLDTAMDVARAMEHLHAQHIVHSDLKPRNVLLKANPLTSRGFIAKVADFGLSVRLGQDLGQINNVFQGTLSHMAPETLLHGLLGKPADVFAFGMVIWEMYTGERAYRGMTKRSLVDALTRHGLRPSFPPSTPPALLALTTQCWSMAPAARPTFSEILHTLQTMAANLTAAAEPTDLDAMTTTGTTAPLTKVQSNASLRSGAGQAAANSSPRAAPARHGSSRMLPVAPLTSPPAPPASLPSATGAGEGPATSGLSGSLQSGWSGSLQQRPRASSLGAFPGVLGASPSSPALLGRESGGGGLGGVAGAGPPARARSRPGNEALSGGGGGQGAAQGQGAANGGTNSPVMERATSAPADESHDRPSQGLSQHDGNPSGGGAWPLVQAPPSLAARQQLAAVVAQSGLLRVGSAGSALNRPSSITTSPTNSLFRPRSIGTGGLLRQHDSGYSDDTTSPGRTSQQLSRRPLGSVSEAAGGSRDTSDAGSPGGAEEVTARRPRASYDERPHLPQHSSSNLQATSGSNAVLMSGIVLPSPGRWAEEDDVQVLSLEDLVRPHYQQAAASHGGGSSSFSTHHAVVSIDVPASPLRLVARPMSRLGSDGHVPHPMMVSPTAREGRASLPTRDAGRLPYASSGAAPEADAAVRVGTEHNTKPAELSLPPQAHPGGLGDPHAPPGAAAVGPSSHRPDEGPSSEQHRHAHQHSEDMELPRASQLVVLRGSNQQFEGSPSSGTVAAWLHSQGAESMPTQGPDDAPGLTQQVTPADDGAEGNPSWSHNPFVHGPGEDGDGEDEAGDVGSETEGSASALTSLLYHSTGLAGVVPASAAYQAFVRTSSLHMDSSGPPHSLASTAPIVPVTTGPQADLRSQSSHYLEHSSSSSTHRRGDGWRESGGGGDDGGEGPSGVGGSGAAAAAAAGLLTSAATFHLYDTSFMNEPVEECSDEGLDTGRLEAKLAEGPHGSMSGGGAQGGRNSAQTLAALMVLRSSSQHTSVSGHHHRAGAQIRRSSTSGSGAGQGGLGYQVASASNTSQTSP